MALPSTPGMPSLDVDRMYAERDTERIFPRFPFAIRGDGPEQCWIDFFDTDEDGSILHTVRATNPATPAMWAMWTAIETARAQLLNLIINKGTELHAALMKITGLEQAFAAALRFAPELAEEPTAGARVARLKVIAKQSGALISGPILTQEAGKEEDR